MVQLGPDYDLAVRFAALEDAVRRLTGNPLGTAFSQTQSDGTLGFELFQDPVSGGTALGFRHGPASPFSDTTSTPGTAQHPRFLYMGQLSSSKLPVQAVVDNDAGFVLLRDDGTPIVVVTQTGGLQFFDKNGTLVFATDEVNGGLANFINYPLPQPMTPQTGFQQGSGSMTGTLSSQFVNYSPFLRYQLTIGATNNTATGACQVVLARFDSNGNTVEVKNGTQVSNSGVTTTFEEVFTLTKDWIGAFVGVQVNAQGGTSAVAVSCQSLYGFGRANDVTVGSVV